MNTQTIRRWAERIKNRATDLQDEIEIQDDNPDQETIELLAELSEKADALVARCENRTLFYDADKDDREGYHEEDYDLD